MTVRRTSQRPKTWSILGDVRKKPSEYEIVTAKSIYHFRRQPSPFELDPHTPINEWYLKYREGSAFQVPDWESFRDSYQLTYRRYIQMQHEHEIYIEKLIDQFERHDADTQLDSGWVKVLEKFYIPSRFPIHVLQMSSLYLAQLAPSAYISNAAFFQAADELRRLQWVAYRAKSLALSHYPTLASSASTRQIWEEEPLWQPLREATEKLLLAYDWGEAFVALNLVIKPIFDTVYTNEFAHLAHTNGDELTALMLEDFALDSKRSRDWSLALAQYAIAGYAPNKDLLLQWVEKWRPLALHAAEGLLEVFTLAPRSQTPEDALKQVKQTYLEFLASWSL